jgi:uncharacterized protein (TIGR02001 family)
MKAMGCAAAGFVASVSGVLADDFGAKPVALNAWDIALGASLANDYLVRGITQSAHMPAIGAYIEPRYAVSPTLQVYSGLFASSIDFPNRAAGQFGVYGGIRPTFGKLSIDVGAWYLDYQGGMTFDGHSGASSCTTLNAVLCNVSKADLAFWETYVKPGYAISDRVAIGANIYYSPSVLNSGAWGTYASVTGKLTLLTTMLPKEVATSLSVELGRYWFGTTDAFYGVPAFPAGIKLPDYTTWNIGLTVTYKLFSLDLRYYDTDLSKANCNVLTDDHTATLGGPAAISPINPTGLISNWCSAAFVAKLGFDATLPSFK